MAILGEHKINIHVEPVQVEDKTYHMENYDFTCVLYVNTNKEVTIKKDDTVHIKKKDADNYRVLLTSDIVSQLDKGIVKLRFIAEIPDDDFADKKRTEIEEVCTGVVIK